MMIDVHCACIDGWHRPLQTPESILPNLGHSTEEIQQNALIFKERLLQSFSSL